MAQYVIWDGLRVGAGPISVVQVPREGEHVTYLGHAHEVIQVTHDYDKGFVRISVRSIYPPTGR